MSRALFILAAFFLGAIPVFATISPQSLSDGIVRLPYPPPSSSPNRFLKFSTDKTDLPKNLVWSATGVPPGLIFNRQGVLSGKPKKAGTFTITVFLKSGRTTVDTGTFTLTIVESPNPVISGDFILPAGQFDQPYQGGKPNNGYKLSATGGYPFSLTQSKYTSGYLWQLIPGKTPDKRLPQGMTMNANGVISGTPKWLKPSLPSTPQTYTIQVRATDFLGKSATATFSLVIEPPQGPEIITDSPLPQGLEIYPYSLVQLKARNGKEPYKWPKPEGLPPGLVWSEKGYIYGRPTTRGDYPIDIQVVDANGLFTTKNCSITIRPAPEMDCPDITCVRVGDILSPVQLQARGGDLPYKYSAVGLPPSISINSTTGIISGDFTVGGSRTYNATYTVRDAFGRTINKTCLIDVRDQLVITSNCPLPYGVNGTPYSANVSASGGNPPYLWSVAPTAALPQGLDINPTTGQISGTPRDTGNFFFDYVVTDACGKSAVTNCSLKVYDPLKIVDTNILNCYPVDQTISPPFCLTASGGLPGYEWSIVSGRLPTGFHLSSNGCITGATSESGSFTVSIKLKDQNGSETQKTFSFFISDELKITSDCPPSEWTSGTPINQIILTANRDPGALTWSKHDEINKPWPPGLNIVDGRIEGTPMVSSTANYTFAYQAIDTCGKTAIKTCSITIYPPLTCDKNPDLPCVSIKSNTVQIVVDNDFAVFAGNSTNITRKIYQNLDGWPQQIAKAAIITFDLLSGENAYYILAIDWGPPADLSGKINGINIADLVAKDSNKIKVSKNIISYLFSKPEDRSRWSSIESAKFALENLTDSDWKIPSVKSNTTVLNQNPHAYSELYRKRVGFDIPSSSSGAAFFRVSTSDLGTFPATVVSTVSGGNPPYQWDLLPLDNSGRILPSGMDYEISENGTQLIIKGSVNESGTFSFISRVMDSYGNTCTQDHTFIVNPELKIKSDCPLSAGTNGTTYTESLIASDGMPPYNWSLVPPNDSLPAGLTLNSTTGEISGTPMSSGNFSLTFKVQDDCGNEVTKTCTLSITNPIGLVRLANFSRASSFESSSYRLVGENIDFKSLSLLNAGIQKFPEKSFSIGKTEVTISDYNDFLNATAKTDPNNLYNTSMQNIGIQKSTTNGTSSYTVDSVRRNYPIAYVSWFDAARYANWLANGKPTGPQSSTTTEDGAYTMRSSSLVRNSVNPNTGLPPTFWLLNESEWYTSAYLKTDGSGLWTYPTQSHTAPDLAGNTPSNFANFNGVFGETTEVGFFNQSPGPFGTFDQAGNLREWTETLDLSSGKAMRIIRGGSWADPVDAMRADESHIADPTLEDDKTGFRIGGAP